MAQNHGNSWINFSLSYFKFPIYKEGIYRIDSAHLAKYFNLAGTNPKDFQLVLKGNELPLYVKGGEDNQLNQGDYIEFYANNFMGDVDSLLYSDISYVPNPYTALYNDTIYAFLTLNPGNANKRFIEDKDTNSTLYAQAPYFYSQQLRSLRDGYNDVKSVSGNLRDPRLTHGEGWGSNKAKGGSDYSTFVPLFPYTLTPVPSYFSIAYSGSSRNDTMFYDHQARVTYTDLNNNTVQLSDTIFTGFASIRQTFTISNQTLGSSTQFYFQSVASPSFSTFNNLTNLQYFKFVYPRNMYMDFMPAHRFYTGLHAGAGKQTYNFMNLGIAQPQEVLLYDLSNNKKMSTVINLPYTRAVLPNSTEFTTWYIAAARVVDTIKTMKAVSFKNYSAGTAPYVIIYHKHLESSASAYRDYRQSAAGGAYNVIMADVEELYEQFAFGIRKNPLAIRNFSDFLRQLPSGAPKAILLLGASASPNIYPSNHALNYIPSIGWPSSDNLLTAATSPTGTGGFYPEVPIGRIAAKNNAEVIDYLTKIQQHESTGDVEWKKKVLHFVGGDTEYLSNLLSGYMENYENTIEDTLYGAQVHTFRKSSSAPIQVVVSDSIKDMVNAGAALMTFFGHGSRFGFDQAIDEPELYQNAGKYPFIVANSCYSGDIHDPQATTVSKRFVFAKQKGSIGFLASNSIGFVHALYQYSQKFYQALSITHYNKPVGEMVKEAAYLNSLSGDFITKLASLDMTLHGDPAVRIGNGALPDYRINSNDVQFRLKDYKDTIGVQIVYKNVAKAVNDSIRISIERNLPGGDTTLHVTIAKAPFYKDSLLVKLPTDMQKGIGLNRFKVTVDFLNKITEANESNNSTGFIDVFVPGTDITPVYPYLNAVVPKSQKFILKASTTDPFAPSGKYVFQLDTCDLFRIPIQSTLITTKGGVVEWEVDLPFKDSTVYYWRVSRDSTSALNAYNWRESSFQVVGEKYGWGQAHFDQFKYNGYQLVTPKYAERKFIFENRLNTINARAGIHPYLDASQMTYYFNNALMDQYSCTFNGWNFAVFDSISGLPRALPNLAWDRDTVGQFNNCLCGRPNKDLYAYYFGTVGNCNNPNWQNDALNFLNSLAPNNYVLAYSTGLFAPNYSHPSSYSEALYKAFESIGSARIRTLADTVPMVLFGKKGMLPGQAKETVGANKRSVLYTQDSIKSRWDNGYIASEKIGPSSKWNSLHWRVKSVDNTAGDITTVKVIGIKTNGAGDTLAAFNKDSTDVMALHKYVDAKLYPYLKLVAFMSDNVNRTSPQLQRWHVLYDEAAECAINPLKGFASVKDTLQEGDEVLLRFPIENIGAKNFEDSLVITYWIEDNGRNRLPLPDQRKKKPFKAGEILVDTVKINSVQLAGNNALWISVNPVQHPRYQLEQHQFNNVARYPFNVFTDVTNPLLDVTFDGRRILNGDIVSARPEILVTLKDENKFLAINDTSSFTVWLLYPNQSAQQRIYFAQGLEFRPADLPKNSASILYKPYLATDGRYTLIVQARDRSRNQSGAHDYRIQFEVDNHPSVTNVMNYPNPFTTSTRFVFTITGSQVPEVFTVQIMTITGKIVREITRGELGTLRVGRNITEYAWDGRDNFGDRLGNGVYLYRVISKLNGETLEKRASGADQFFTKEFGKMVLMK